MHRHNPLLPNLFAMSIGLVAAGVLTFVFLEAYYGNNNLFYVHLPNQSQEYYFTDGAYAGCPKHFRSSTNRQGMRGEDYPTNPNTYRVLAMGGSTTICGSLDDSQTWPALVQSQLRSLTDTTAVWVGNAGKSGSSARHHFLQIQYLANQYPIDAIVLLAGFNDLALALSRTGKNVPSNAENRFQEVLQTFDVVPDSMIQPFYKRLGVWKLAKQLRRYIDIRFNRSLSLSGLKTWYAFRRNGRKVMIAPDLTDALAEYAQNLAGIIALARRRNIRIIMMTQPVLWKEHMTRKEEASLVFGFIGDPRTQADHPYYATGVLARGMDAYNQRLINVCRQHGVEYIDLAAMMPRNLQIMYDDCHFTVAGAELVSDFVASYLGRVPPFSRGGQGAIQNQLN